jgi:hypothetical protein
VAVEDGEPVREPHQTAAVRPDAAHAVVAHVDRELAVLDPCHHLGASGASVLGTSRCRFSRLKAA